MVPLKSYKKETWTTLIEVILQETEASSNTTTMCPKRFIDLISDSRPHLFFAFPHYFQQPPTSLVGEIKRYCFQTKAQMIGKSLEKDTIYENTVFQLFIYHKNLNAALKEQKPISDTIKELIEMMKIIDSTRAAEIRNTFYARCFLIIGLSTLSIAIGNIFKETHWISTSWLFTIAKISSFLSLLTYGLNWLYHHGDAGKFNENYKEIKNRALALQEKLKSYDDNMRLSSPSPLLENPNDIIYEKPQKSQQ